MNLKSVKSRIEEALATVLRALAYKDSRLCLPLARACGLVLKRYRGVTLMPVSWLDQDNSGYVRTLAPESRGNSYGPLIGASRRVDAVRVPPVNLYCFRDASVNAVSSSIILEDKALLERAPGVDSERCDFASGHILMHGEKRALVKNSPREELGKGLFLGGNGAFNYFHWLVELLPKLEFFRQTRAEYPDFPLLVSEDVRTYGSFRDALDLLAEEYPLVYLSALKTYRVRQLVYINAPNCVPFNLKHSSDIRVSDSVFRSSSIDYLRRRLGADPGGFCRTGGRRLFIGRRSERRSYNQAEIFRIFEANGFSMVFPEDLSLRQQGELFSNAEYIAGPSGAAWTNLLFCRKGARALCWMAEEYSEFAAFSNLAHLAGVAMRYLTYPGAALSTAELSGQRYHLNADGAKSALHDMLSS